MNDVSLVYVSCQTYNHSAYIKDALDGFCLQHTSFPFVCGIIDDASTDGEQAVIYHYIEEHFDLNDASVVRREETDNYKRIFARHKENKNCFFAAVLLKYNHLSKAISKDPYVAEWKDRAKYVALCEGDDYWIDPLKLQKQVSFMEGNPKHSLCFCAHKELFNTGVSKVVRRYEHDLHECPMDDIILGGGGYMATGSVLYRKSLYVPYMTWAKGCPIGDLPLMLSLAHKGQVGYLSDVMSVYRRSASGSWSVMMNSNIKLRRRHSAAINKMWLQFDKWSDRLYHRVVSKKIRKNIIDQFVDELASLRNRILNR